MSLSKALRRYISLPIASDQSAQLVPGLGGDKLGLGIKLGLRPLLPNKRALYTVGGTALCYIGNNSKPIRSELKHKGAIGSKETIES